MEDGENGAKCLLAGYSKEKSTFFKDKLIKHAKVLELGREKRWRGGEYTVLLDFLRQIDW